MRHLLHRGEGQHGTQQPTTLGTPTGRTPTGSLGTQLWTCGVPASEGVSLSQCRCFCQRFHLAMCAVGPICHRRVSGFKAMLLIKNLQQIWQTKSLLLNLQQIWQTNSLLVNSNKYGKLILLFYDLMGMDTMAGWDCKY